MTGTLKKLTRLVPILLVVLTALPGAMATRALAQTATVAYTSELSGIEVEAARGFEITDTEVNRYLDGTAAEHVDVEMAAGIVRISFYDDAMAPGETVREFTKGFSSSVDSFAMLGAGNSGDAQWALAEAALGGAEVYYYISVTPDVAGNIDVMTVLTAPRVLFLAVMEDAQLDVTLDGAGVFGEADLDALEGMIAGEKATPGTSRTTGTDVTKPTRERGQGTESESSGTPLPAANVTVSQVTSIEVETRGDWQVTGSEVYGDSEPGEESLQIQSRNANGYVAFFHEADAEASLRGFLDGFDTSAQSRETIASDYRNGIAWSFDDAVLGDGNRVYVYTEVREGLDPDYVVLSALLALPDDFFNEFADAQENVSVDGDAIFLDVAVADLERLIVDGSPMTPVAGDSSGTQAEAEDRRDRAKLPGGDVSGVNETETASSSARANDLEKAGLLSETEYTSPQFGVDVAWGDRWYVDTSDEDAVTTDASGGLDSLILTWDGPGFALMFIDISTADGLVPGDFVEYWTSAEYMRENTEPGAESLLYRTRKASGAVLLRDYLDIGDEVIILKEAILLDDGEHLGIVTLITTPDVFSDMYVEAQEDVTVGGVSAAGSLTPRQVDRALAK